MSLRGKALHGGTTFEATPKPDNLFLVNSSSQNGSQLVNSYSGCIVNIREKFPEGVMCIKFQEKFFYDLHCVLFQPSAIQLSPTVSVYALYHKNCMLIERMGVLRLLSRDYWGEVTEMFQSGKQRLTLEKHFAGKALGERFGCWLTPTLDPRLHGFAVVPCSITPELPYTFNATYEKIRNMFLETNKVDLGIVVAPGKMACNFTLMNCPLQIPLGSINLCLCDRIPVSGFQLEVLVKCKELKVKSKYLETVVTPGGSVLIKTVIGKPVVGKPQAHKLKNGLKEFSEPCYNYSNHHILGKIIFSNKILWSAPTLKVYVGATVNSDIKRIVSSANGPTLKVRYHLLAFHDGKRYWRVPDIPREMYDSINFLTENGVKLWGDKYTSEASLPRILNPPIVKGGIIEGRLISNVLIKHPEIKSANNHPHFNCRLKKPKKLQPPEYVTIDLFQVRSNRRVRFAL